MLRRMLTVSSSTMLSWVLGLLRDILTAAFLGTTVLASAFAFAFAIPNLFRRLLGEGALTSAFIPVLTDELKANGKAGAYRFANEVMSWVAVLCLAIVIALGVSFLGFSYWASQIQPGVLEADTLQRWSLGFKMAAFLMPYMALICMSAVFAALLNVLDHFAIPALSPVLLNGAMIAALLLGGLALGLTQEGIVHLLCWGVLLGGLLQFLAPALTLMRFGWQPALSLKRSERLDDLVTLFVPGLGGAAIMQINILVSRFLAYALNKSAVASLYYANRLVELPLGVFAIAITTVIFPRLSKLSGTENRAAFNKSFAQGIRFILVITVPAAIGLMMLNESILSLLFQWGEFDETSLRETSPLLFIFAASLPLYALSTFVTRTFHSLKDARTPVKIAFYTFLVNFSASIVFMLLWSTPGLALANAFSVLIQTILLLRMLNAKAGASVEMNWKKPLIQIVMAGICMGIFAKGGEALFLNSAITEKVSQLLIACIVIPLAAILYFSLLWLMRFEDRAEFETLLKSKLFKK